MMQSFDPAAFKSGTRDQWDQAAAAWDAWRPTLEEWLAEPTATMLDLARVTGGAHVLDVAAGAGGQSVLAARRAGPQGRVLATDISAGILELAQRRFDQSGLANATTKVMDGEELAGEEGRFDAVICRLGLMYFPDRAGALAAAHRALRPGGRFAAVVFGAAADNVFFSLPVSIIRRRAGLGPAPPGQPGPFSLAADGVLEQELAAAGFIELEVQAVEAPLRLPSAAVPAVREGVVRRASSDAVRLGRARAGSRLGGGRCRAEAVRGTGWIRRAVPAAGRRGNAVSAGVSVLSSLRA